MKKITLLICVLCLVVSFLTPCVCAEETDEAFKDVLVFTSTTQISHFIQEPWPDGEIRICPAILETADGTRDVYLVTVRGIDWTVQGCNHIFAYFAMLGNHDCKYYNLAKSAILDYVPAGATIVMAGHSLGGMVVQRLICDADLTEKYDFLNAVTFGSPYVVTDKSKREGTLVRLEDKSDAVPKCSLALFLSPSDYKGGTKMDGEYKTDLSGAHNVSYKKNKLWGSFDALGVDGGSAVLTLDLDKLVTLSA